MTNLYINKAKRNIEIAITEDDMLVEYYDVAEESSSIEGNIYVGKVRNVIQGMQSFFVDIGEKRNGFLFFNDIYEKYDGIYSKENVDAKKISQLLKNGQNILVQIKKEPVDKKGAKLTTDISFVGRYFILTPKSHFIAVSKKIDNEDTKQMYVEMVKKYLPENLGGIIRTNILEASKEEIQEEILTLINKWNEIKKIEDNISSYDKPSLVYKSENMLTRTVLDVLNKDLNKIYVNDRIIFEKVKSLVQDIDNKYLENIEYVEQADLLKYYYLREKLIKEFEHKIWLKCGGYIIIDKTEALTAIDVNTGKYVGGKDLENTIFKVNKEAVVEIARQLRLRNIGGIIVVDFIDMDNEEHKNDIFELLQEQAKKDRSKIDVKGYTKLNLMEITRKKKKV